MQHMEHVSDERTPKKTPSVLAVMSVSAPDTQKGRRLTERIEKKCRED
jgi:hypothetical protein